MLLADRFAVIAGSRIGLIGLQGIIARSTAC